MRYTTVPFATVYSEFIIKLIMANLSLILKYLSFDFSSASEMFKCTKEEYSVLVLSETFYALQTGVSDLPEI